VRKLVRAVALVLVAGAVVSAVALAHGGRSDANAVKAKPNWFADVAPIVQGRCVTCHRPGGIAPFSLRTYEQARANRQLIAQMVRTRRMPPWSAARGHRAYRFDPSLSNAQIATITRWVAQGAKRGTPKQKGKPVPPVGEGRMRVDLQLRMKDSYTPRFTAAKRDDYRCFVLDWPATSWKFITGFQVVPGQPTQVHHMTVYGVPGSYGDTLREFEGRDPQQGYDCFGGPSGVEGPFLAAYMQLAAWAPGSLGGQTTPTGTGMPIEPGTKLVLEIHYNSHHAIAKADRTTVHFRLADSVERPGLMVGVFNPDWILGSQYFSIPRGQRDVTYTHTADASSVFQFFEPGTVSVDMAQPHMHLLGSKAVARIERANSSREVLVSVPKWDFRWQRFYWFKRPVPLRQGDGFSIECHYDNTAAHQPLVNGTQQTPRDVTWGVGSSDEMCMVGLYLAGRLKTSSNAALRRLTRAAMLPPTSR
jgi:hypothetical protein